MKIYVCENYEEMSRRAADVMCAQLLLEPDSVLGLATGSTPIGLYKVLVERCARGEVSFRRAKTVNLDEYCGLPADHGQSYAYFMRNNLFDHIDIDLDNTNIPDGMNSDESVETKRYDGVISALGGIDLQLLGIGDDGHIGFNEPSDVISVGTQKIALTQETIKANSRFFSSEADVPKYAYSIGCGAILSARKILFLASGSSKAEIVERSFFGAVTPHVPASLLQLVQDKVFAFCDRDAAQKVLEKHPDDVIILPRMSDRP